MNNATIGAQRRFLDTDVARLENVLHDAWVVVSSDCPLFRPSITTCWVAIGKTLDAPDCISNAVNNVLETRQAIYDSDDVTVARLDSAVQNIVIVENFLYQRFSKM